MDKTNPECTRKVDLQAQLTAEPSRIRGIRLPPTAAILCRRLIGKLSAVTNQQPGKSADDHSTRACRRANSRGVSPVRRRKVRVR